MTNITAPEIRAAASYLKRRGFGVDDIPPRRFALAAKDLDKPFKDTLRYLGGEDNAEERRDYQSERGDGEDAEAKRG